MRKNKDFTLVELLVVVAIIAALMAILLPGLDGARRCAHKIACQSNLKQVALCEFQYMDDYNSHVAPVYVSEGGNVWNWYCASAATGFHIMGDYLNPGRARPLPKFLFCPLSPRSWKDYGTSGGYSLNYGKNWWTSPDKFPGGARLSQIRRPSVLVDFLDGHNSRWYTAGAYYSILDSLSGDWSMDSTTSNYNYSSRHGGTCNCVFFDGHSRNFGDLKAAYASGLVGHYP